MRTSPLLFAVFLDDFESLLQSQCEGLATFSTDAELYLSDEVNQFLQLFYADDTIIMAESGADLQRSLNVLKDYCQKSKPAVYTSKTEVVIFPRGRVRDIPRIVFGEDVFDVDSEFLI